MVIDKIRKMSIKGVKLKSESFFSISPGVLELWRKTLGGGADFAPPVQIGLMVKDTDVAYIVLLKTTSLCTFVVNKIHRSTEAVFLHFLKVYRQ